MPRLEWRQHSLPIERWRRTRSPVTGHETTAPYLPFQQSGFFEQGISRRYSSAIQSKLPSQFSSGWQSRAPSNRSLFYRGPGSIRPVAYILGFPARYQPRDGAEGPSASNSSKLDCMHQPICSDNTTPPVFCLTGGSVRPNPRTPNRDTALLRQIFSLASGFLRAQPLRFSSGEVFAVRALRSRNNAEIQVAPATLSPLPERCR